MFRAILLLAAATALHAQTAAELGGTVRDASGALVPGVAVAVTKLDTQTIRNTVTNEAGYFVVPLLPPGEYQIKLSKEGFKTVTEKGIILQVNEQARQDFTMDVGAVVESVTINSTVPLLETASAARGQVIDNQKIVDLPLNGRDYLQLALVSVGAGQVPTGRMNTFSASGQRAYDNTYLLDGADNNTMQRASQARRAEVVKPSIDAIQEFKVLTNAYSAEFGRAGGGVVSLSIKSGTNAIHGSAFEFLRNDKLDGRNFFDAARPSFKRNQYGASAGGPVKKNKTFIFGDYEATRVRQPRTVVSTVPTVREISGDFGELLPGTIIYDPATYNATSKTRTPFANNRIPASSFDPVGVKLASFYPTPNQPGLARNFLFNPPGTDDVDRGDVRIDHNLSERNHLFGRYSHSNEVTGSSPDIPGPAWGNNANATPFTYMGQSGMLGYDHVFSPRFLVEAKLAWNQLFTSRDSPINNNVNSEIGLKGVEQVLPGMAGVPVNGYAGLGLGANIPNLSGSQNRQAIVNFTSIRAAHTLKWGANLNWIQQFLTNPVNAQGSITFNGEYTRDTVSLRGGSPAADLLLGTASAGTVSNWVWNDLRRKFFDFFVQDEWRISRRLTLTPGLRYELHPQWIDRLNQLDNVFFSANAPPRLVLSKNGSQFDRALVNTDKRNFAPRMGLAWQLGQHTVIRAGYGIYFGNDIGNISFGTNPPYSYSATLTPDPTIPSLFLRTGLPSNLLTPANASNISLGAEDPNRRNPYNQQWNFTIQQQLRGEILVEIGYVGATAHRIQQTNDINSPPPGPGQANSRRPIKSIAVPPDNVIVGPLAGISYEMGNSNQNYEGLQVRVEKRLTHGLSFSVNYVFSKTISDGEGGASIGTTSTGPQDPRNLRAERALADEYFKHRFVPTAVYDLPFGRGRKFLNHAPRALELIAGGWTGAAAMTLSSGLRVDLGVQGNPSNTGGHDRPNVLHDWYLGPDERSVSRWFDTTAFAPNAAFTFGNAARNLIGGPPLHNLDMALYKTVPIVERVRIQFRAEAFNATNTPYFGSPNANVGAPAFGQISSANPPRNLQFALKVLF
jgi:Carboxypeptidase regulatory-like domain/TonB dependent receptor-like, beta-barrel